MKINLLKILVIIICFFSFKINAELVFEDNFPKNLQGIWSEDCESEYQVFIISNNTSMWIDETYVGFNISKNLLKVLIFPLLASFKTSSTL